MAVLQKRKDGKYAIVIDGDNLELALKVYAAIDTGLLMGGFTEVIQGAARTMADVTSAVAGQVGRADVKLRLNSERIQVPTVGKISGLNLEKKANETSAMLFDKIEATYNRKLAVYFRPFYTALEEVSGVALSTIHKERTKGLDTREFPNRKIDTVLTEIDPEFVHKFAREYQFQKAIA